ncbi:MAG: hypothetical protein JNM09_17870 [Blastocatellia bacterium]|nr:hypothetical protein [Blastocatellia bacterium]
MNKSTMLTFALRMRSALFTQTPRPFVILWILCFALTFLGCQQHPPRVDWGDGIETKISVDDRDPPTFQITGTRSGHLQSISVVRVGEGSESTVWEITPDAGAMISVANTPTITYGVVPAQFQEHATAPPLQLQTTYRIWVRGVDVAAQQRTFHVK